MADVKITDLAATASSVGTDVLPVVVDVTTVPITKKITLTNLIASIAAILKIDDLVHGDDNTDLDASTTYHGLLPKRSDKSYSFFNGKGAYDEILADGWINPDQTWTYASAVTFTVPTDLTALFVPGLKLKLTNTTVKYFYVASSSYGAPNTTVTLITNSDYALVVGAISDNFYSRIDNPKGFPDWFNYVPALTGWNPNPASGVYRFKISAKTCTVNFTQPNLGTSNATTVIISAPITAKTVAGGLWFATCLAIDNNVVLTTPAEGGILSAGTTFNFYKDCAGAVWTNPGNKRIAAFQVDYEIP